MSPPDSPETTSTRTGSTEPPGDPADRAPVAREDIERGVIEALKTVYDPEIPVNIYELGLIYGVDVTADGEVTVRMTLTAPACPAAGILPGEVETKARAVRGVRDARVDLVWDPPWSPERMSDAARLQLGMM